MPTERPGRPSRRTKRLSRARAFGSPLETASSDPTLARVPHPYERFVPRLPLLPYWVLLPMIGVAVFAIGESALAALGDRDYPVTQAIFAIGLGVGPALLILLSHSFDSTLGGEGTDSLACVLWPAGDDRDAEDARRAFGDWLAMWQRHIFGLQTKKAWATVVGVEILGMSTLLASGLPFRSALANGGCIVLFAALLWLAGQAAFTFAQLLRFLTDIGSREVYVPFSRIPHPALSALLRYYSGLALLTVVGYGVLAIAVWEGPYGLSVPMLAWVSVLAAFPIAMTTWSFMQTHALLRRAKQHHLDEANALVMTTLGRAKGTGLSADLEAVQKALAVQDSVQRLSEWPFAPSAAVAFAAALAAGIAQGAVAVAALSKL
jgi:hypothetical protein